MKSAASLYKDMNPQSAYYDHKSKLSREEYAQRLKNSTTLYVGNLSFYTLESQLLEFFSSCGQVVNLIMGLNRMKMQPCGFCFVEYATRQEAALAVNTLNRQILDGMVIRVDWDFGFEPNRQFGRGRTGGQVRDEIRNATGRADQHRDADRPLATYSHAKRDYSQRRGFNQNREGGGGYFNRGDNDGGDGNGQPFRRHQSYDQRGGYNPRKRTYRDRYGGDGEDAMGSGGPGGDSGFRYHQRSTQPDEYRDFDSEQMGMQSKRRRMNNFGNDMGEDPSMQQQIMGMPPTFKSPHQKDMAGAAQQHQAAGIQ